MRRDELTDFEWKIIEPLLPSKSRGVPRVNDRRDPNGILWRIRTGSPWRDTPERYSPSTTCYNRFVRWREAGVWDRIQNAVSAAYDGAQTGRAAVKNHSEIDQAVSEGCGQGHARPPFGLYRHCALPAGAGAAPPPLMPPPAPVCQ
jgi:transposase